MLAVGSTAPDFTGTTGDGERIHLYDLLSRQHVVLYFYNRNFSAGCTAQARVFRDNARHLAAMGAGLLGVSKDPAESNQAFVKSMVLGYPLLTDPGHEIIRLYDVKSFFGVVDRVTYVIDRQHVIRMAHRSLFDVTGHMDAVEACVRALAGPDAPVASLPAAGTA